MQLLGRNKNIKCTGLYIYKYNEDIWIELESIWKDFKKWALGARAVVQALGPLPCMC